MYNQYISAPREEVHNERRAQREEAAEAAAQHPHAQPVHPQAASAFGNLSQVLTSRFGSLKFDADTLIALAVIWFLVNDGGELDTELMLMIGILLILGI